MKGRLEIQRVVREHHGWVLARLVRTVRDLDLAEDALQEALLAALHQWPASGVPDSPRAWLITAARHKAVDELRRRTLRGRKSEELEWLASLEQEVQAPMVDGPIRDDMLRLIFTCCHPSLSPEARIALTLRAIAGLETEEIARAFLVTQQTMAQRLVRAKKKIRAAGVPYRVPGAREMGDRVREVLVVVYLIFNEGYVATAGEQLVRRDLCGVAIRLGRALAGLLVDQAEVFGLLALMTLHDARSDSRSTEDGDLVLLEDQDRTRWDRTRIDEGVRLTRHALGIGPVGPYALQAAIAAVHAEAPRAEDTDWEQILALYDQLVSLTPTPVVALNRAVALAMVRGPDVAIHALTELAKPLDDYLPFHASHADLLRRTERFEDAAVAYRRALALSPNDSERRFLEKRLSALG